MNNHFDAAYELIKLGANVNSRSSSQITPLIQATMQQNLKLITLLINNNANINEYDSEKNTCIHYAAKKGYYFILQFLLKLNPNL